MRIIVDCQVRVFVVGYEFIEDQTSTNDTINVRQRHIVLLIIQFFNFVDPLGNQESIREQIGHQVQQVVDNGLVVGQKDPKTVNIVVHSFVAKFKFGRKVAQSKGQF